MASSQRRRRRIPGRIGLAIGVAINLSLLFVVHQHETWRPWIGGVVTERWVDALWAVDLSLLTAIAGGGLLVLLHWRWLYHLVEAAKALAAGLSLVVLLQVFPFDFSQVFDGGDGLVRVGLSIALVAVGISVLLHLVRVLTSPLARRGEAHA